MIAFGFAAGLALAYSGWTALSLGMDRHYADIHGRDKEPDQRGCKRYRLIGTLALIATFAVSVRLEGWTIGAVLCLGTMTTGALLLVLLLTYAPHRAVLFGKSAGLLSILLGLAWLTV
jgi:hypothetical protein